MFNTLLFLNKAAISFFFLVLNHQFIYKSFKESNKKAAMTSCGIEKLKVLHNLKFYYHI